MRHCSCLELRLPLNIAAVAVAVALSFAPTALCFALVPSVSQVHLSVNLERNTVLTYTVFDLDDSDVHVAYQKVPNGPVVVIPKAAIQTVALFSNRSISKCVFSTNLTSEATFQYSVLDGQASLMFSSRFVSAPSPSAQEYLKQTGSIFRFAFVADTGADAVAQRTSDRLASNIDRYSLVVHGGDISYANSYYAGQSVWDAASEIIQQYASNRVLLTAVGNHEREPDIHDDQSKFSSYIARFETPGNLRQGQFWYSLDVGPVHFVFVSSEHQIDPSSAQYAFLLSDLEAASEEVNRMRVPWIILVLHRPLFCSNEKHGSALDIRGYIDWMLSTYGVDLILAGHVHAYERSFPVMMSEDGKSILVQKTELYAYEEPRAPVHVVAGIGGRELVSTFQIPHPEWSAVRNAAFHGYVEITVDVDRDELIVTALDADSGKPMDEFVIRSIHHANGHDDSRAAHPANHGISAEEYSIILLGIFLILVIVLGAYAYVKQKRAMGTVSSRYLNMGNQSDAENSL
eukprot:ANDGO_05547.mRNA.1 Purple acid phosphatase 18